jgi:hypothetical protein
MLQLACLIRKSGFFSQCGEKKKKFLAAPGKQYRIHDRMNEIKRRRKVAFL